MLIKLQNIQVYIKSILEGIHDNLRYNIQRKIATYIDNTWFVHYHSHIKVNNAFYKKKDLDVFIFEKYSF